VVCHRNTGARRGRALLVITALTVFLLSTAALGFSEEDPARLRVELSDTPPSPGSRITLEVVVPTNLESDEIEIAGLDLPDIVAPNPNTVIETGLSLPGRGFAGRAARVRIEGQAARPGRAVLESFRIHAGEEVFETEPQVLEVSVAGASDEVPFGVSWRVGREELYQNEVVPISLVIENAEEYVFPDSLEVPSPEEGEFVEVQAFEEIERREVGNRTLFTIPIARFLYTVDRAGSVELPQARVQAGAFDELTRAKELTLRELPEEVRGSNAVGVFEYDADLEDDRIAEGDSTVLTLRVRGRGNLETLQIPSLESDEFVVTELEETHDIAAEAAGFVGTRELRYRVTPRSTGVHSIRLPEFVWLDPELGGTQRGRPAAPALQVEQAETAGVGGGEEGEALAVLDLEGIRRIEPANYYRRAETYLWLLPGIIVVLLGVSGVLPTRGGAPAVVLVLLLAATASEAFPEDRVTRAIEMQRAGSHAEALEIYDQVLQERPDSPGLLYNSALALYNEGAVAEAVYRLRRALRANARAPEIGTALAHLEARLGLEQQPEPSRLPHPDVFVIAALVLVNLLCLVAVFAKRRFRGATVVIIAVFAVVLTLASAGFALASVRASRMPVAIVGPETAVLRRIPDADADAWLRLEGGTAVQVLVRHRDFQLVRTGYGVEGWLSGEAVVGTIGEPPPIRKTRE